MIAISLDVRTALACICAPGEKGCPYCKGQPGAIPNLNRTALERAMEIIKETGSSPVHSIEMGYLPDAASPNGKRFCAGPLTNDGNAFLAEGKKGEALLILVSYDNIKTSALSQKEITPGDALYGLPDLFYPAMDLPPILWEQ